MTVTGSTASFYPDPRQYLHTEFKKTMNNNNIWGFGTPEVDELIEIYEEEPGSRSARGRRCTEIDEIVHDEAFYIPFWAAPYLRLAYWDYVQFPDFYLPKRTRADRWTTWSTGSIPRSGRRWRRRCAPGKALPLDERHRQGLLQRPASDSNNSEHDAERTCCRCLKSTI